jgi:hypothetical protein
MHTSITAICMFWGAVGLAFGSQLANYRSTAKEQRTIMRKCALGLGLSAVILSGVAGWRASVDWGSLPRSSEGLRPGQLFLNGGFPNVVE